jgi:hypothetical protein
MKRTAPILIILALAALLFPVTAFAQVPALICGTLAGLKYGSDAINNRAPNASAQVQPPDNPCPDGASGTLQPSREVALWENV